jgi:hypothetical protein
VRDLLFQEGWLSISEGHYLSKNGGLVVSRVLGQYPAEQIKRTDLGEKWKEVGSNNTGALADIYTKLGGGWVN